MLVICPPSLVVEDERSVDFVEPVSDVLLSRFCLRLEPVIDVVVVGRVSSL